MDKIRKCLERKYGVEIKDEDFISQDVFMTYGAYRDGVMIAKECTLPELEDALINLEKNKKEN